jgi:ATP-dependent DNA ligase
MLIERMRKRLSADRASFIEPCLPSSADKPPSGANWIHEIKHDGYRLMARRDPVGIRLITRKGNDWTRVGQFAERRRALDMQFARTQARDYREIGVRPLVPNLLDHC